MYDFRNETEPKKNNENSDENGNRFYNCNEMLQMNFLSNTNSMHAILISTGWFWIQLYV